MELSIVIPALNEERTITFCIEKALKAIRELGIEGEVVVSDNGSTDRTVEISTAAGARVVHAPSKGYGSALIDGFRGARGRYMIMADADDSYNLAEIGPFYRKLREGYDFVIGNRFKGKIEKGAMPPLHRYLGTPVLTFLLNLFFRTGIGDTNCGMRGLTKEAFHKMHLRAAGMEFATEMVIKASLRRLRIAEVPCNLYRDKRNRKPHLRSWHDGWRHLRFMLLFTPLWTFLIPGVAVALTGLTGMAILIARDLVSPGAWQPYLTQKHMISAMLLYIVGVQIFSLGLAAEAFTFSRRFDHGKRVINFLNERFTLERGIMTGLAFMGAGILAFIYLFASFIGVMPSISVLLKFDLAVVAAALVIFGTQLVFTSFLLSLFYIKVK